MMGMLFFGAQELKKKKKRHELQQTREKEKVFQTTQMWNPEHHIQFFSLVYLGCGTQNRK